jgi:hypothetical protein
MCLKHFDTLTDKSSSTADLIKTILKDQERAFTESKCCDDETRYAISNSIIYQTAIEANITLAKRDTILVNLKPELVPYALDLRKSHLDEKSLFPSFSELALKAESARSKEKDIKTSEALVKIANLKSFSSNQRGGKGKSQGNQQSKSKGSRSKSPFRNNSNPPQEKSNSNSQLMGYWTNKETKMSINQLELLTIIRAFQKTQED